MSESETAAGSAESDWMQWLGHLPDAQPALRAFACHYHYFSLNQVAAFSRLLAGIPRTDRTALALFADVLYEELGRGTLGAVHSVVFERFARAVGVDPAALPLPPSQVAPGVRWYVCELELAFGGPSLARALATYSFLESAAVQTYGPLLQTLRGLNYTAEQLEFFARHATVEVEHAEAARQLVERAALTPAQREEFEDQTTLLGRAWQAFWHDIHAAGRAALE